jgi:ribosomal protein S18 acetylase RimI-like enzyme
MPPRALRYNSPVKARIWVAGRSDLVAAVQLLTEFRDWWRRTEPSEDSLREMVAVLLDDPATEFLLGAADGGDVAGVCQLRYRMSVWSGAEDCWLEDLYVRECDRRHGLGRALVEAAMRRARGRGCRRIELDVQEDNEGALAFYRSRGFVTEPKGAARTLLLGMPLGP